MRTQLIAEQSSLAWWGKIRRPWLLLSVFLSLLCRGGKKWCRCSCEAMISPTPPNLTARRSSVSVHKSRAAYSWNYPESSTCNKQTDRFRPDYITPSVQVTWLPALLSFPPQLNCVSLAHILNFLQTPWNHLGHTEDENKSEYNGMSLSAMHLRGGEGEACGKGGESDSRISPFGSSSGWS